MTQQGRSTREILWELRAAAPCAFESVIRRICPGTFSLPETKEKCNDLGTNCRECWEKALNFKPLDADALNQ